MNLVFRDPADPGLARQQMRRLALRLTTLMTLESDPDVPRWGPAFESRSGESPASWPARW
jgi:hypothetical protein